jgi:hypothetical protein
MDCRLDILSGTAENLFLTLLAEQSSTISMHVAGETNRGLPPSPTDLESIHLKSIFFLHHGLT